MRLKQQHPKIASVIISPLALSLPSLIFSMADIASGVAALAIPSIFALMHAVISSVAMFSLKDFGKISFKIGLKRREIRSIIPAPFNKFIIPFQNAIIPMRDITKLTLFDAPFNTAELISAVLDVNIAKTIEMVQSTPKHFPSIIVTSFR